MTQYKFLLPGKGALKNLAGMLLLLSLCLLLSACGGRLSFDPEKLLQPPRLATQTANAEALTAIVEAMPTSSLGEEPIVGETETPAPSEVISADADANQALTVWVNQTSEAHRSVMHAMGKRFAASANTQVEFIFVEPFNLLPLLRSAQLAGRAPDIILHDSEQTALLQSELLLDAEAASGVAEALGKDAFAAGALEVASGADGVLAALPVDGWQYLLIYRRDWFADAGLPVPNSFERILNSAETFDTISFATEEDEEDEEPEVDVTPTPRPIRSGIVVPTEQDSPGTQRVFEWLANANGCQLVDESGELAFESDACLETLEFYRQLINQFGPPDYQTNITALKAFADGRTSMVMLPPASLAWFAENGADKLTEQIGIVTEISGDSPGGRAANFSNFTMLGITPDAPGYAPDFVEFWFQEGYGDWLSVEPESKYPLYHASEASDWMSIWEALPIAGNATIDQLYPSREGQAMSRLLGNNLMQFERWGGMPGSELLSAQLYDDFTIAPILTRMLSGYIGSAQANIDASEVILEHIVKPEEGEPEK